MADQKRFLKTTESWLESLLFSSRWILAPFYAGLAFSLIVLLIKFAAELLHMATHAFTATESEVILGVLALVDLTLTGSLIIIVIFSGYENFVSRIDHGGHTDWPEWMGKIDFSGLKLKLLSSIVAISGIQLLKQFMSIQKVSDRDIMWLVIVHVVFVVSSVLLALSDRLTVHGDGHGKKQGSGGGPDGGNGGKDHKESAPHTGIHHGALPGTSAARSATSPSGERGSGAATSGTSQSIAPERRRSNVEITRVEINRTRNTPASADTAQKPASATKPAAPSTASSNAPASDDRLLPGERVPTIKRRLH